MNASPSGDITISPAARLVATLRSRHWSTFLLELVLITLGILIALSIDARIQDRKDRAAERDYLTVLSRDLGQMGVQLQRFIEFETRNTESAAVALRWLNDGDDADYDSVRADLWALGGRRTLRLVSAAYTDLLSTGNLQLIRERALRDEILRFFAEVARAQLVIEKNNTAFVDEIFLPFLLETGVAWAPTRNGRSSEELEEASALMRQALGAVASAPGNTDDIAPSEPGWRAAMRQQVLFRARVSSVGLILGGSLKDGAAELQAMIDAELASR